MTPYTVVSIYHEGQPYVEWVHANSPKEAAGKARKLAASFIEVVAVLEGHLPSHYSDFHEDYE